MERAAITLVEMRECRHAAETKSILGDEYIGLTALCGSLIEVYWTTSRYCDGSDSIKIDRVQAKVRSVHNLTKIVYASSRKRGVRDFGLKKRRT